MLRYSSASNISFENFLRIRERGGAVVLRDDYDRRERFRKAGSQSHAGDLESDQAEDWLTAKSGTETLKAAAEDVLQEWPVSRRVNSARADWNVSTLIARAP